MRGWGGGTCSAIEERPGCGGARRSRTEESTTRLVGRKGSETVVGGPAACVRTPCRCSVLHILSTGSILPRPQSCHRPKEAHGRDGLRCIYVLPLWTLDHFRWPRIHTDMSYRVRLRGSRKNARPYCEFPVDISRAISGTSRRSASRVFRSG